MTAADAQYLEQHRVRELIDALTKELFQDRPPDVVEYLIEALKRKRAARDAATLTTATSGRSRA